MKNKILYTIIALILALSCSEDVLDVPNENEYDGNTFFTTAASYSEAANAMYTPLLYRGMYSRGYYFIFDLLGNDASKNFPLVGGLLELPNFTYNANSAELNDLWNDNYKLVFRTNFVLDLMGNWDPAEESEINLKNRITGEALFLKSFAYFVLVNSYGSVPYKETIEDHEIIEAPRTPEAEIWMKIESNLKTAIEKLPVSYESEQDYGRVTKGAAVALLGKAYLYQNKFSDAITELKKLTMSPYDYELAETLDDLFVFDNKTKESIFQVMHGEWQGWGVGNAYYMFGGQEGWGNKATHSGRAMEYGFNDWWNVLISEALIDAFSYEDESGQDYIDPRAELTYYDDGTFGGDTVFCEGCEDGPQPYTSIVKEGQVSWRKYEFYETSPKYSAPNSFINSQVIRYADVLLMLAEAYIEEGQIENALPLINEVRARSGAFEYSTLGSKQEATDKLRNERQIELAGEQSRFFDLIRWGIFVETINAEKQAAEGITPVRDYHVLFPIPQVERDANPVLDAQVSNNWN